MNAEFAQRKWTWLEFERYTGFQNFELWKTGATR